MTLIARPMGSVCPMMVSDILVSSTQVTTPVILPTMDFDISVYLSSEDPRRPVTLNQKTYIITDNICISFSGIVFEIRALLRELKTYVRYFDHVNEQEIRRFFEDHYDIKNLFAKSSCHLILVEKNEDGSIESKEFSVGNWKSSNTNLLETMAAGSGSQDFIHQASQNIEFTSSFENNSVDEAFVKNLSFLAQMLAVEKASLYSIKKHWGAGYEFTYYDGHKFIKCDELAYIISEGDFNRQGGIQLPFPIVVMYYKYIGETLFITSLHLRDHHLSIEDNYFIMSSRNISVRVHRVEPLIRESIKYDLPVTATPFETGRVALGYFLKTGSVDNGFFSPSLTTFSKDLIVRYTPDDGVEIKMKIEINELIRDKSHEVYLRNGW